MFVELKPNVDLSSCSKTKVLDQTGMSGWGWSQCSPVTVDNVTKTVTYEGSYWATKHYSYYIDAGAAMVSTAGDIGKCITVNGVGSKQHQPLRADPLSTILCCGLCVGIA